MTVARFLAVSLFALSLAACGSGANSHPTPSATTEGNAVEHLSVEIVETYPFDEGSFTQGLEVAPDGSILVGTGWVGESRIYRRTLDGTELVSQPLDDEFFGEGITQHGENIWQLTWRDEAAIRRDATTLTELERVPYPGEGWGICSAGDKLITSDGTAQLRRLDPHTLDEHERVTVTLDGTPVTGLNELECVDGTVYANIFMTTDIVQIDAATGAVTAVIDASGVPNNATPDPNHVLNGIAHIPGTNEFYLTGKRWPDMYRVRFTENTGAD